MAVIVSVPAIAGNPAALRAVPGSRVLPDWLAGLARLARPARAR
jgi:hypothetical protein